MQQPSHLLMIRPVNFGFNAGTAVNNHFQKDIPGTGIQQNALKEFDALVSLLRTNNIDVTVIEDTPEPNTPDSIFPNNWISFHEDGSVFLYPMFAVTRRLERKAHVLELLRSEFNINRIHDLSHYEDDNVFLEGTGSMVLDRTNKIAYACISPRTDLNVLDEFCRMSNYRAIIFSATDSNGLAIYHTNVMMCVADSFAVICLESITDMEERQTVAKTLVDTRKEIIDISQQQLNDFAGNMLELKNNDGELLLVMSTRAYQSLNKEQITQLEKYNRVIHSPLTTIETVGGGSARCMMAELVGNVKY